MADFSGDPTAGGFVWPPPEWGMSDPLSIGASEYAPLAGTTGTDPNAVPVTAAPIPPITQPFAQPVSGDAANGYTPLTPFTPAPVTPKKPTKAETKSEEKQAKTVADILGAPTVEPQQWPPASWSPGGSSLQPGLGIPTDALSSAVPAPGLEAPPAVGGEQPTLPADQDPWANTQPTVEDALRGVAQPAQPGTDDAVIRHNAEQLASDPMALATANQHLRDATQNYLANRMEEINAKDKQKREDNEKITLEATTKANADRAQLEQDAKDLANGGYGWAKLGTGSKIAAVAAIIAGGLHSSLKQTNGQNLALQIVQKNLDDDLAARQHALQQRRQMLGDRYTNIQQQQRDLEAHRIAGYDEAIKSLQVEMMKYDPGGRAATELANTIAGVNALKQQAINAFQDRSFKQAETSAKIQLDYANAEKAKAEAAKANAKAGGGGGSSGYTYDQLAAMPNLAPFLPPRDPKNPHRVFSTKETEQILDVAKKSQEVAGGGPVGSETRHLSQVAAIPGVTDVDEKGKPVPFLAKGTDAELAKLRDRVSGTQQIAHILDEAMKVRTGWSSDVGNSDEKQQLESLMGQAKFAIKNQQTLGQITESDLKLIEGGLGTADFTKYRDFAAGVAQARKTMIDTLRDDLIAHGLSKPAAAKFDIPNSYELGHANTARQDAIKNRIHERLYQTDHPPTTDEGRKKAYEDAANSYPTVDEVNAYRDYLKRQNPHITDQALKSALDLYQRQPAFR